MIYAAEKNWPILSLDVSQAFLQARLPNPKLVVLPPEALQEGERDLKVAEMAIYALKQSPKAWRDTSEEGFLQWGWKAIDSEAGVYYQLDGPDIAALTICHVADILIVAKSNKEAQRPVDQVTNKFNATKGSVSASHESRDDGDRTIEGFDFLGVDVEVTYKKYQEPDQKIVAVHFRCANRVERILRKHGYTEIREQTLPAAPRHLIY